MIGRLKRDQVSYTEKGLLLIIWLIVCLKVHNNIQPTIYKLLYMICGALRLAGIEIAHDPSRVELSNQYLESSLTYWYKRIRHSYSDLNDKSRGVQWERVQWWSDLELQPLLFKDRSNAIEEQLLTSWEQDGLTEMVKECVRLELSTGHSPLDAAVQQSPSGITNLAREILVTMPKTVPRACILGKLGAWYEVPNSPLRNEMELIAKRDEVAPGIYANFFTDQSGMALSPAQLEVVVVNIKRYLDPNPSQEDNEWAYRIDRLHWPKKKLGKTAFTERVEAVHRLERRGS